jgi:hypothetical protein
LSAHLSKLRGPQNLFLYLSEVWAASSIHHDSWQWLRWHQRGWPTGVPVFTIQMAGSPRGVGAAPRMGWARHPGQPRPPFPGLQPPPGLVTPSSTNALIIACRSHQTVVRTLEEHSDLKAEGLSMKVSLSRLLSRETSATLIAKDHWRTPLWNSTPRLLWSVSSRAYPIAISWRIRIISNQYRCSRKWFESGCRALVLFFHRQCTHLIWWLCRCVLKLGYLGRKGDDPRVHRCLGKDHQWT